MEVACCASRFGGAERPGLGGQASTGSDLASLRERGCLGDVSLLPPHYLAVVWPCGGTLRGQAGLRLSPGAQVAALWLEAHFPPQTLAL